MAYKSDMPSSRRTKDVVDNNAGRSDGTTRDGVKHDFYTSHPAKESPSNRSTK